MRFQPKKCSTTGSCCALPRGRSRGCHRKPTPPAPADRIRSVANGATSPSSIRQHSVRPVAPGCHRRAHASPPSEIAKGARSHRSIRFPAARAVRRCACQRIIAPWAIPEASDRRKPLRLTPPPETTTEGGVNRHHANAKARVATRRRRAPPTSPKPSSIIAQVAGSGMAPTMPPATSSVTLSSSA